jgi:hypothetical protein
MLRSSRFLKLMGSGSMAANDLDKYDDNTFTALKIYQSEVC